MSDKDEVAIKMQMNSIIDAVSDLDNIAKHVAIRINDHIRELTKHNKISVQEASDRRLRYCADYYWVQKYQVTIKDLRDLLFGRGSNTELSEILNLRTRYTEYNIPAMSGEFPDLGELKDTYPALWTFRVFGNLDWATVEIVQRDSVLYWEIIHELPNHMKRFTMHVHKYRHLFSDKAERNIWKHCTAITQLTYILLRQMDPART